MICRKHPQFQILKMLFLFVELLKITLMMKEQGQRKEVIMHKFEDCSFCGGEVRKDIVELDYRYTPSPNQTLFAIQYK